MDSRKRLEFGVGLFLFVGLVFGAWTPLSLASATEHLSPCSVCEESGAAPHTKADQGNGAVVTTGVQFPRLDANSALAQAAKQAANCPECEWTIIPACQQNEATQTAGCQAATTSCAGPDEIRYRVYMRIPPGPWQLIDTVCLGPTERPASVADIGEIVRERVVNYLPDASPSFQPPEGGLVNLPTLFAAGEPGSIRTESFDVLGFQVVVTATARWEWTFDNGVTQQFTDPGGAYPDQSVSYTYMRAGERDVMLTTYWKASFTIDGDGPFAVPGPEISKTVGPIEVPVRQAGAVLVGG